MSLTIRNVYKHFPGSASDKNALHAVDVDVVDGELLVLLGPSGSGKTTLLRCVAGLIQPSGGMIKLGSRVVSDSATGTNVPTNKRDLGMVFQSFALWPHMTVAENVAYPLKARRWTRSMIDERVAKMMDLVHCTEYAERLPATLSGGQQQRIALARALAANPAMILFDEPLSNLDALLRVELRTQVRLIHRETKFTGVYVTHDQVEAMSLGDRVAVMNHGAIEQIGTPEEIYFSPKTEFVATFMGMSNRLHVVAHGAGGECDVGAFFASAENAAHGYCVRFRPENVQLFSDGDLPSDVQANGLLLRHARVVDRAFHGESLQYVVAVRGDTITAAIDPRKVFQPGDAVTAVVAREGAGVFGLASEAPSHPRVLDAKTESSLN